MNRRCFLKALNAAAIAVVLPLKFIAPALHERAMYRLTLAELISTTLRVHSARIAANVNAENVLLKHLMRNARGI